ncbi:DNA translocase FtsK [Furfurilactobacillus sp. WILCCON 0119]
MKHYDGPTFFRQHPEEFERAREQRQHRLLATPAPRPSSTAATPMSATSEAVRYGSNEVELDRSMAMKYASQQARAIAQTVRPRRAWHTPASEAAVVESTVSTAPAAASVTPVAPEASATSEAGYVSAVNRPFSQASTAFSEQNNGAMSAWGSDDWSHEVTSATETSAPSAVQSLATPTSEPTSATEATVLSDKISEAPVTTEEAAVVVAPTTTVVPVTSQPVMVASTAAESAQSSEAPVEPASVTPTIVEEVPSVVTKPASAAPVAPSRPQGALGHGLADIFNEEQNGQKDLALFNNDHADSVDEDEVAEETSAPITELPSGRSYANEDDKSLLTYHFPSLDLLKPPVMRDEAKLDAWIENQIDVLNETLSSFHVSGEVVDYTVGPTVTQFQVSLGPGVRVNKITNLQDDLKLALAAKDIRIEAPIPGKSTVGIEIPDLKSRPVMLSEVLRSPAFQNSTSPLTVALGVDLFGQPQVTDLRNMPHGLIAGATGSGKSVFINSLLLSILYKATPQEVKLILIDPKAVEMAPYNGIPHLLSPVVSEPQAAAAALKWTVTEMEERYQRLAAAGARNIEQYNDKAMASDHPEQKMPYIVIIIDELADLMMVASSEVQDYIARITQKARAAGIHLLVATQRPSVDVVTGTIKNNIPTRVAFMVSSQIDSRTILDTAGAERLLGRGDMLYLGNGKSQPIRLQGTYVDAEIDAVTDFVREQMAPHYAFEPKQLLATEIAAEDQDDLWPEVLTYVADEKTVSTSKLQRVFSIGYNRAANLVDQLESNGYVSAQQGSKPREVYLTPEQLNQETDED